MSTLATSGKMLTINKYVDMPSSTISNFKKYYFVYVLESMRDAKRYVGFTVDLRRRFEEHCQGRVISTYHRRPLRLIYFEACLSENDARRREKYLKTSGVRIFLAKRLQQYYLNI
ncbi:MAG: GIY-YIG nuclease family protein [Candidatus Uhrbacteria bacterium]